MTICASPIASPPVAKDEENWSRALRFPVAKVYRPSSRGEIVQIIKDAEDGDVSMKWAGSFWSFMGVFVNNNILIESDNITGLIDESVVLRGLPLSDESSRDSLRHVKGGTKVRNVNRRLHGLDASSVGGLPDEWDLPLTDAMGNPFRALPTMGGSGGQSIAGVLATGSHGGDVRQSPLADSIQAIHLIGPGGQEWWIERTEGLTAGSEAEIQERLRGIAAATDELCDGIIVKKNDDIFRAVMVSVGRMGFVYSLVIKTVRAFLLEENRSEYLWRDFSADQLSAARLEGYLGEREKFFVQVLINPFATGDGYKCRVAERVVVEEAMSRLVRKRPKARDPFLQLLCGVSDARFFIPFLLVAIALLITMAWGLTVAAGVVLSTAVGIAAIPPFGWAFAAPLFVLWAAMMLAIAALYVAVAALAALITYLSFSDAMTTGDLLANITALFYAAGLKEQMKSLFTALFESQYSLESSLEVSWKIMDTYDYQNESFCEKVDSMEFAFDATEAGADAHLEFVSDALAIFDDLYQRSVPVLGLLALRFMRRTESLIGMTKFPLTCHVEIPLIRNFGGNVEILDRLQQAAIARGGVPHWGQLMATYNADDVQRLHGADLDSWRNTLGNLIEEGGGKTFTFSNNFTLTYNLEPAGAGLPDDCATGGPYPGATFGTFNGPGSSNQRVEGDATLDRVDNGYGLNLISVHGNITLNQKVNNNSTAGLTACGTVTIGEKVDQHSGAVIQARGDVVIGQGVDQWSHADIESTNGNITIGEKVTENSRATLKARGIHIGQKIDQHSQVTIVADGDVVIDQGIDQHAIVDITSTNGNIVIGEINETSQVTMRAMGVNIGQKIDQHSTVTILADGDVVISQGIDQHATVDITSAHGSILIGQAVDGNASAILRAPNGVVSIGEKVAGGASVQWAATSFSCPDVSGGTVTPI